MDHMKYELSKSMSKIDENPSNKKNKIENKKHNVDNNNQLYTNLVSTAVRATLHSPQINERIKSSFLNDARYGEMFKDERQESARRWRVEDELSHDGTDVQTKTKDRLICIQNLNRDNYYECERSDEYESDKDKSSRNKRKRKNANSSCNNDNNNNNNDNNNNNNNDNDNDNDSTCSSNNNNSYNSRNDVNNVIIVNDDEDDNNFAEEINDLDNNIDTDTDRDDNDDDEDEDEDNNQDDDEGRTIGHNTEDVEPSDSDSGNDNDENDDGLQFSIFRYSAVQQSAVQCSGYTTVHHRKLSIHSYININY